MWTVVVTDLPAVVPVDGGKDTASVSNTRKLGSLDVVKTVNWNGVTPDPTKTFEICIKGPSFPLGTEVGACKNADFDGQTLTWTGLIPGSYDVTETDPGNMWTVVVTDSPAVVPVDGGKDTASVSNTRKLGSLDVVKTVNTKTVNWDMWRHLPTPSRSASRGRPT